MTNIVERLRIRQPLLGTLCDEAADEIERLRAAYLHMVEWNERLRDALRAVAAYKPGGDHQAVLEAVRRALEPKP